MLIEAVRRTQQALDAALGDAELADRLAEPVVVRELTPDEARRLWPQGEDFQDTQPMVLHEGG